MMDSFKNARWANPFKKFSRLKVNDEKADHRVSLKVKLVNGRDLHFAWIFIKLYKNISILDILYEF